MVYSGTSRDFFENKQARADFIQKSFQTITDNKEFSSMGFAIQQLSPLQVSGEPNQSQC